MKTKYFIIVICFTSIFKIAFAQTNKLNQTEGGGNYRDVIKIEEDISEAQRQSIKQKLWQNEAMLKAQNKLQLTFSPTAQAFIWPIKQSLNYNDPGFYGISNYVDENTAFPNQVQDYNCGTRSYDLSTGYNHKGTDIFTWPFGWGKMNQNTVEIIAAAPGTIIGKDDGNFDQNCAFCTTTCNWNAVYIQHGDGSVAWYGHMKTGSLTTKAVGQQVVEGEYLGIVGSSGNSTGPHLHLEIYTNTSYTQLVDPWAGPCNLLNGNTSWWANQESYYVPTLNKIITGATAPQTGQCPMQEISNEQRNFKSGQLIYLSSFYRDQRNGQQSVHKIFMPDNTLYQTWTQNFTANYDASYWWFSRTLPTNAQAGVWRYEITFNNNQVVSNYFTVNDAPVIVCANNYNTLAANITGNTYQWQLDIGSGFANIADDNNYAGTTTSLLQLKNTSSSFYGYKYRCLINGGTYSNTITLKFTSYWLGKKNNKWEDAENWSCGNIPDANTDVVINSGTPFSPTISSMAVCRSTNINPTSNLQINTGFNLTVTGK